MPEVSTQSLLSMLPNLGKSSSSSLDNEAISSSVKDLSDQLKELSSKSEGLNKLVEAISNLNKAGGVLNSGTKATIAGSGLTKSDLAGAFMEALNKAKTGSDFLSTLKAAGGVGLDTSAMIKGVAMARGGMILGTIGSEMAKEVYSAVKEIANPKTLFKISQAEIAGGQSYTSDVYGRGIWGTISKFASNIGTSFDIYKESAQYGVKREDFLGAISKGIKSENLNKLAAASRVFGEDMSVLSSRIFTTSRHTVEYGKSLNSKNMQDATSMMARLSNSAADVGMPLASVVSQFDDISKSLPGTIGDLSQVFSMSANASNLVSSGIASRGQIQPLLSAGIGGNASNLYRTVTLMRARGMEGFGGGNSIFEDVEKYAHMNATSRIDLFQKLGDSFVSMLGGGTAGNAKSRILLESMGFGTGGGVMSQMDLYKNLKDVRNMELPKNLEDTIDTTAKAIQAFEHPVEALKGETLSLIESFINAAKSVDVFKSSMDGINSMNPKAFAKILGQYLTEQHND